MAALTHTDIIEILIKGGGFAEVIGAEESDGLEFKTIYSQQNPSMKADLVADVASFGNATGGIIIEGVKCKKAENSRLEIAAEIVGVEPDQIDEDQRRKLIRAHIHPLVQDLELRWYPPLDVPADIRLIATVIGAQKEHDKPFIVDIMVRDESGQVVKNAFGWPVRSGADTHWTPAAKVQQLIADGQRRWSSSPSSGPPTAGHEEEASAQLEIIEQLSQWDEWGGFIVQCVPPSDERIPDFHGSFAQSARAWKSERAHGFDLPITWDSPASLGSRLIGEEAGRTALVVSKTGVVSAGALANPDFLGWAANQPGPAGGALEKVVITQLPLIEFVTEAIRFAYGCVGTHLGLEGWEIRAIGVHLLDRAPVVLNRRKLSSPFPAQLVPVTTNEFRLAIQGTGDPHRDAKMLLGEIYGESFGLGINDVPFVEGDAVNLSLMN